MIAFEKFLIEKGYKKYRTGKWDKDKKEFELLETNKSTVSSMDCLAFLYTKDLRSKKFIIVGLHEAGKPPTLISPRPKIEVLREIEYKNNILEVIENEVYDDSMNRCLQKESNEDIYKAMYDFSIVFKYNLINNKNEQ